MPRPRPPGRPRPSPRPRPARTRATRTRTGRALPEDPAGSSDRERPRTIFLGSGAFAVPILHRLVGHEAVRLVAIVTAPPRPAGRHHQPTPTPVHAAAAADPRLSKLPVLVPERLRAPAAVAEVLALDPELLVLADYGQIVPPALLDLRHGALNLHPSLLPRHRGAAPIPAAILAGDDLTGVTLMRMDAGLDIGPIVAHQRVALDGRETTPDLERRLADVAAGLLDRSLGPWIRGELPALPQAAEGATLTRPLRRADGRLDPEQPALELERRVRALRPWPGTAIELADGERLVVTEASVAPSVPGDVPGELVREGDEPALATRDGRLVLRALVPAGRRAMSGADWLRGRRAAPGPEAGRPA